jgi:hypothetical protein
MSAPSLIVPSTPGDTARLRRVLRLVAALTALFLLVWRWPFHDPFAGAASYLPLHTIFENIAIVVSMLVFGVAWNAYNRVRPSPALPQLEGEER